jgi:hypothetical protein
VLRLPPAAAALLVLTVLLAGAGTALYQLWTPAWEWVARAPQDLARLENRLHGLARSWRKVSETAAQADQMTDVSGQTTQQVALRGRVWARRSSAARGTGSRAP